MSLAFTTRRFVFGFAAFGMLIASSRVFAQSSPSHGSGYSGDHHSMDYGGGYGSEGYYSSTVGEGLLRGSAALVDSLGNFDVREAQSAILQEQARALTRENNLKQTAALVAQKKIWTDARAQERKEHAARVAEGRKLLAERRATFYRTAYALSEGELDFKTGTIGWPIALGDERFQANRERLEELFRKHVGYGTPRANMAPEIARAVDQWARVLRNEVGSMSREDYLAAQKFLLGLKYGAASTELAS